MRWNLILDSFGYSPGTNSPGCLFKHDFCAFVHAL
jgi:hypothetical protein